MTTVAEAIERCRNDYLHVGAGGARNKHSGALGASDETLTFTYPLKTMKAGSKISNGLEDMHVWTVDDSTKTAEVDRGEYGTTAAAISDGDVFYIDAPYTDAQILRAMTSTVSRLVAEGIFQVTSTNLTYTTGVTGYDVASSTDVLGVVGLWVQDVTTSTARWSRLNQYRVQYGADTSIFPSGTAIHLHFVPASGAAMRIQYRSELGSNLASLTDVIETVTGLESDAVDLLPLGAAIELTAGREVERNQLSGANHRRSDEVPPGAWTQAPSGLRRLFRERVKAEKRRLADKYPQSINVGAPAGLIAAI